MDDRHYIKDLGQLAAVDELTVRRANDTLARQRYHEEFPGGHTVIDKHVLPIPASHDLLRRLKLPWDGCP